NDAGILLAETTIDQTRFDPAGVPLAGRARKAIQYGESIDAVVRLLSERNNGLYSNEWLVGDTKTNEVALYEMGTHKTKLRRSSTSGPTPRTSARWCRTHGPCSPPPRRRNPTETRRPICPAGSTEPRSRWPIGCRPRRRWTRRRRGTGPSCRRRTRTCGWRPG